MATGDKQKLITKIVSIVLNQESEIKKFEWFINKHNKVHFGKNFEFIDLIFKSLNGDLKENQAKRNTQLECDAYFGGQFNFIFEFDEFQHFSSYRLESLKHYPQGLILNYDTEIWKTLCLTHSLKADKYRKNKKTRDFNFLGGRTAQRAYLDCFRDLLPEIQGLNPTLRINEFEVPNITEINKESLKRIEQLLKNKIS